MIRIITETGLRVYKELAPMGKDQVDLVNAVAWIPESKTPNGVAEVPLILLKSQWKPSEANWRSRVTDRGCFRAIGARFSTKKASGALGALAYAALGSRISGFTIFVPPTRLG